MYFIRIIIFISLFLLPCTTFAQKCVYTTERTDSELKIDGIFNEEAWNQVGWSENFVQREPFANRAPSQETRFKVLYDNENIYFAIKCFDVSPDSIVKRLCRRDGFDGDWVEINIDSYHDLSTAFSFNVNASGVKGDEAVTNDGNWDPSWDPIWDVKVTVDSFGWNAEFSIPLTQLRFAKQDNYVWGLQVNRRLFRKEEYSSWQFISPNAAGWVHNFGELYGISNIQPQKQRDITPYAVGGIKSYQRDENNPFADGKDLIGSVGVDGKFGLTNNLTLDFTVNPDFGQVEADPSEVNLTTFETKFAERRPFFIEGKNILSYTITDGGTPMSNDNLFYSRRIGRKPSYRLDLDSDKHQYAKYPESTTILGAFKITGKTQKGWSIGVFESITQEEKAEVDTADYHYKQTIEPFTNYFAGRLLKDFNSSNTRFGVMFTATNRKLDDPVLKEVMPKESYSAGFDLYHQWKDKTYYVTLKGAFSTVSGSQEAMLKYQTEAPHYFQRPDAKHLKVDSSLTHLEGNGGIFQIGKSGNSRWVYCTWITWRTPGMNLNDEGYMNRNDEIQEIAWIGFRQREPFSVFRNFNANVNQWYGVSFGNERRYLGGNMSFNSTFKNYWAFGAGISRDDKAYSTETLRGGLSLLYDELTGIWANGNTDSRKKIHFYFNYYAEFRDNQLASYQGYTLGTNYQATDALKISLEPFYSKRWDKIDYVNTLDDLAEPRYIRGTVHQETVSMVLRVNYSLTPDFSIQFYAMPFISAGKYSEFKYITTSDANEYANRFVQYNENQLTYRDDTYSVDENIDGIEDYSFDDPNFNSFDFNANLVIRWEYQPGSTIFLVWSQNRNASASNGNFLLDKDTRTLFDTYPTDVIMLKLSYRFAL